jgi:hypothetical protein
MWVAAIAAPAIANDHVRTDEGLFDFFYESATEDLVLVTGPPFEQGCPGEGFTLASMTSILKDGLYTSRMNVNGTEMRLYEAPSFDVLINEACGAVFGGGDMPQPIAFGVGSWTYKAWDQAYLPSSSFDPPAVGSRLANSATATMTFTSGMVAEVRGIADYVWTAEGPDVSLGDILIKPAG